MRVILLAGGPADREPGCPQDLPRPFWPVLIRPLVLRAIDHLISTGVRAIAVCANGRTALYADRLSSETLDVDELHFSQDPLPRGPAGCLKDNEKFVGDRPFLVANAACWTSDPASWLMERHRQQGNKLTVFTIPGTQTPSGIYICEPDVLAHIPARGYCDIKEQLIPRLVAQGLRVGALPLRTMTAEVLSLTGYLSLHRRVLSMQLSDEVSRLNGAYRCVDDEVWISTDAHISRQARLFGPVVVGANARIDDGAIVIGPTTIGTDAVVGRDAVVTECAVWPDVRIPRGATVSRSVLAGEPERAIRFVSTRRPTAESAVVSEEATEVYV